MHITVLSKRVTMEATERLEGFYEHATNGTDSNTIFALILKSTNGLKSEQI